MSIVYHTPMGYTESTYRVPGISCAHCEQAIASSVGSVAGVTEVRVDLERKLVTVAGDASDADVRAAIDDAGYDVED
jgi:copper chaperone